jgi:beta-lactamase class A
MQQRIDNPLLINAENKSRRIEPATMASWIDIVSKPSEKSIDVVFNKKRVDESLRSFSNEVDYAPVPTVITYLNGLQAGRVDGSVGKTLQYDDLLKRVIENTSPLTSTLEASVVTVPPPQVIDRKYTKDSEGMQTLLSYWTSVHSGDYSIDFRTLNGNISASLSPYRLLPSVGVYRLYIASLVYGRVTAGSTSLSSLTQTGQTVDICLDLMIRESDDGCTNALGALVGWGASDSLLKAQGFSSTTLTEGASLTTANDMSNWMVKLLQGSITAPWQADSLTTAMTRQVFRQGIPAGSIGITVADKLGIYGRISNDAGIIYHPNGTYVLSVLSEGSDPGKIADLTNEINKVMNQ